MSDKAKKEKVNDERIFYIGLIAAVAVVQIVLKVFTTLVLDAQSQVLSRITTNEILEVDSAIDTMVTTDIPF